MGSSLLVSPRNSYKWRESTTATPPPTVPRQRPVTSPWQRTWPSHRPTPTSPPTCGPPRIVGRHLIRNSPITWPRIIPLVLLLPLRLLLWMPLHNLWDSLSVGNACVMVYCVGNDVMCCYDYT